MTASNEAAPFLGDMAGKAIIIGKDYSTAMDAVKVGNTAFNQAAQQALIQGVALACKAEFQDETQLFTTLLVVDSRSVAQAVGSLAAGLVVNLYYAQKVEDLCTLAGTSYIQGLQTQISNYQTLLTTDFLQS